jgi:hypothetical protein
VKLGELRIWRSDTEVGSDLDVVGGEINDTVDLVKRYVVQETVTPLKHVGRVLGYGLGGALAYGVGGIFVMVATLRIIQAESGDTFAGNWSFVPYLLMAISGVLVFGLFALIGLQGIRRPSSAAPSGEH